MQRLRVLLVGDEIMIREGFRRLFNWEAHGCEIVGEATDGMEALTQIDALAPDIVIMDIDIPVMSGIKVIRLARVTHPQLAFVLVSGQDGFAGCQQALRMQNTDCILRPVDCGELGVCLDNLRASLCRRRDATEAAPQKQEERAIMGIMRYLQEHLGEDVSLTILSDRFHLNPQYISQLFRNEIGVGFLAYLTNIRMERAKKLLLSTPESVAGIAGQVGYADYRVFTKAFKKTEGITPSQYRREYLSAQGAAARS